MQQAIYNSITSNGTNSTNGNVIGIQTTKTNTPAAPQALGLRRWVARRWDLVGVVALMGSSAAYAVFALAHIGL